jgi:hypothetical protein
MATAAQLPNTQIAHVWQMPYKAQQYQPINYIFSNTLNRTVLTVDDASLAAAKKMLENILLLTKFGIDAVEHDYKLAKKAIPGTKQLLKVSSDILETIATMQASNDVKLDVGAKQFMDIMKKVQAESHYGLEVLTMFYNLENCETMSGNTYTIAQFKKKFNVA